MSALTLEILQAAMNHLDDTKAHLVAYSGRGMYGKYCAGVKLESDSMLISLGAAIAAEIAHESGDPTDASNAALNGDLEGAMDTDGYGVVIYWSNVEAPDDPDLEDDDEDEDDEDDDTDDEKD